MSAAFRELLPPDRLPPLARGVGQKPEPVAEMRRSNGTSWKNCRPDGVAFRFKVIAHGVEPPVTNRFRNLLSKNDCRSADGNEFEPIWPEVSGVFDPEPLACFAKRLAGTAPRPHRPVVGPPGEAEGVGPPPDPGEEVALGEASDVIRCHIDN